MGKFTEILSEAIANKSDVSLDSPQGRLEIRAKKVVRILTATGNCSGITYKGIRSLDTPSWHPEIKVFSDGTHIPICQYGGGIEDKVCKKHKVTETVRWNQGKCPWIGEV